MCRMFKTLILKIQEVWVYEAISFCWEHVNLMYVPREGEDPFMKGSVSSLLIMVVK